MYLYTCKLTRQDRVSNSYALCACVSYPIFTCLHIVDTIVLFVGCCLATKVFFSQLPEGYG